MTTNPDCAVYLAFTKDTDHTVAVAAFVARFGKQPERVWDAWNILLIGPAPVEPKRYEIGEREA